MKLENIELSFDNFASEMSKLKNQKHFDYLVTIIGEDFGEEGLGCIYILENTDNNERCSVRTIAKKVDGSDVIPTVVELWKAAELLEREVYDFVGIKFLGHPDMRRLFLRTDFNGYPLRKDFDMSPEANQFPLTDEPESDYTVVYSLDADGHLVATKKRLFEDTDFVVNIGPNHPSTHGVLRLQTVLDGEKVKRIYPHLGYIHRGIEKMWEGMTYPQTLALTDRLNYLSAMMHRHALVGVIEEGMGVELTDRIHYIRTIMDELQRIDSHILFFSCLCQDMGATTAFLYGFRDREEILKIFEETCGGRLILNYNTIGGVMADIHPNFQKRVKEFIPYMRKNIKEYHDIFTGNVIFQNRAKGVGVLTREQVISFGCTGGTGRAAGWSNDVRKHHPYAAYGKVNFNEVLRTEGDSFARYMIRLDEILESLNIIEQLIDNIPEGPFQEKTKPIIKVPAGTYYSSVEGSRGEFGVFLESKGDKSPYRLHYRSTGLPLVAVMDTACRGNMIADLITIGGTVDYVVPDIDR